MIQFPSNGRSDEEIARLVASIQDRLRNAIEATFPVDLSEAERRVVHCMLMMQSINSIPGFDLRLKRAFEVMGELVTAASCFTPDHAAAQRRWLDATKRADEAQSAMMTTIQRELNHEGTQLS